MECYRSFSDLIHLEQEETDDKVAMADEIDVTGGPVDGLKTFGGRSVFHRSFRVGRKDEIHPRSAPEWNTQQRWRQFQQERIPKVAYM